ncbi:MAG: hypothetical protein ACOYIG_12265 [Acetivibrionales bacterium]|jgi:hypothetical protein
MKKEKQLQVGDIQRWQGIRNSDTGTIEDGYLYIVTKIEYDKDGNKITHSLGKKYQAKNRSQAIKIYNEQKKNS